MSLEDGDLRQFLGQEVKERKWDIYNYLFIKKLIDAALEKTHNEMEACSKLLVVCTQEFNFGNNDFGYAFDDLLWVNSSMSNQSSIEPAGVLSGCALILKAAL